MNTIQTIHQILNPEFNYLLVVAVIQDFKGNVITIIDKHFEIEENGK